VKYLSADEAGLPSGLPQVPAVELTRRNLETLLAKLDEPGSAVTLIDDGHSIAVRGVENDAHYQTRAPGPVAQFRAYLFRVSVYQDGTFGYEGPQAGFDALGDVLRTLADAADSGGIDFGPPLPVPPSNN
jgi:hypothetical protein